MLSGPFLDRLEMGPQIHKHFYGVAFLTFWLPWSPLFCFLSGEKLPISTIVSHLGLPLGQQKEGSCCCRLLLLAAVVATSCHWGPHRINCQVPRVYQNGRRLIYSLGALGSSLSYSSVWFLLELCSATVLPSALGFSFRTGLYRSKVVVNSSHSQELDCVPCSGFAAAFGGTERVAHVFCVSPELEPLSNIMSNLSLCTGPQLTDKSQGFQ
jgi:hypothetical protein